MDLDVSNPSGSEKRNQGVFEEMHITGNIFQKKGTTGTEYETCNIEHSMDSRTGRGSISMDAAI